MGMGYAARSMAEVFSALLTAIFLLVDSTGVDAGGTPWQFLALGSFVVFVALIFWHINSLNSDLHKPEHQVDVVLRPDPVIDHWYQITTIEETRRHVVYAHFYIDMCNSNSVDRTVNEIYLEVRETRRWWGWPLLRPVLVTATLKSVDGHLDWYKQDRPSHVDWTITAGGPTVSHRLHLEESWDSKKGVLPKWVDVHLVIEVGGRSHKRRIDLVKASKA